MISASTRKSRRFDPFLASILAVSLISTVLAQRGDAPNTRLRPPEEERALFHVPPGFEVQFVAAEPEIQKPMNLAFDSAGRVWVTGSTLYPWPARRDALGQPIATFERHWADTALAFRAAATPPEPPDYGRDTVRVLSDFTPDGRARKSVVFADGLNIPIGVLPLPRAAGAKGDSVIVYSIPAIWRLTDTDGDGHADQREKLYDGFGFKDTHGMSSSYWLWFDGWVYGTHGFSNPSEVTDRSGNVTRLTSGNTYRFRPDGSRFEIFTRGQTNPFGLAFDARGDVYTADSHSKPVYLLIPGGGYEGLGLTHDGLGFGPPITLDDHGSTAIAGIAHYSADAFPAEYRDNLFNGNPVTRRINRVRLEWRGSTPNAARQPDFLTSDDPAFRPVQVKLGPDGALWVADFYNPIIGHYEVPLTHPARDNSHGRIWRIVWRGLDSSVAPRPLPNLAQENTAGLAIRLTDPNLIVRSLAAADLLVRSDAKSAAPALRAALTRLIAGTDPNADGTAALPLFITLDRLEQGDAAAFGKALLRPESDAAYAALRALAARDALPVDAETMLTPILNAPNPGYAARLAAEIFQRHPQAWQPALIMALLAKAPIADTELTYALRVALKTHGARADFATIRSWADINAAAAERIADVCLAVPTPAAAEFLLDHLKQTKFSGSRAGDYARHAVLQLPAEKFVAILPLFRSLARAPQSQRVAFAEGLATVAATPDRKLPDEIETWMRDQLVAAITDRDVALSYRAIIAVKDLHFDAKAEPLRRVALERTFAERNRTAALRSLEPNTPETDAILAEIVVSRDSNAYRRAAADLLGSANASAAARAALAAGFATASADVALSLATALAKSDAGAADLLDLAASGKVRATLLRHRYVATALEKRPAELRERAAALTRGLPPEDARLDAVVALRVASASGAKGNVGRGAPVFAMHCAACHKLRGTGGNIGPSLDGLASRPLARIVEDILDPSRNVDPAFRVTTLTLTNGETKSGINHREEGDRVLLTDPATGQDIILPKTEVKDVTPSTTSPMPATFETALTEQEFFDLLEFLREPAVK
jgi:putative heme-binding domain-containing protein